MNQDNRQESSFSSQPPSSPREVGPGWSEISQDPSPRQIDGTDESERHEEDQLLLPSPGDGTLEEVSSPFRLPPIPQREEPTLKEKLVERERQARVETERARLKRQFALSNNGGASIAEDAADDLHASRENGSVECTVGDGSTVAAPPTEPAEENDINNERLGYVMERFLSESGAPIEAPEEEETRPETGVVMERFLSEPVVVHDADDDVVATILEHVDSSTQEDTESLINPDLDEPPLSEEPREDRNVLPVSDSMDVNADNSTQDGSDIEATAGSVRSYSTMSNDGASVGDRNFDVDILPTTMEDDVAEAEISEGVLSEPEGHSQEDLSIPEASAESLSDTPGRIFRLTEAEIQEMASIEEASIGNAPPSEREDISESSLVGDLIGDFEGITPGVHRTFSERTHTTALESGSLTSVGGDPGDHPSEHVASDEHSNTSTGPGSVSSHLVVSPGGSSHASHSVAAEIAEDEVPRPLMPELQTVPRTLEAGLRDSDDLREDEGPMNLAHVRSAPSFQDDNGNLDAEACAAANAGIVNRTVRPGMVKTPPQLRQEYLEVPDSATSAFKRAHSLPDKMPIEIDGFDFDKNDADFATKMMDSLHDLPGSEIWSPGSILKMSPVRSSAQQAAKAVPGEDLTDLSCPDLKMQPQGSVNVTQLFVPEPRYGAVESTAEIVPRRASAGRHFDIEFRQSSTGSERETQPLLHHELGTNGGQHTPAINTVDDLFHEVQSESTASVDSDVDDCEKYNTSTIMERAFPERLIALLVTLLVEIPVLFMISGGSDRLCMLLGRRRYQLLIGFLPLSSAISGNVGLQASTLTTRAISHFHVTTQSYPAWLYAELGAALFLGLAMGAVLGSVGFFLSDYDFAFAFTVFAAQFVSILTAGLTGTLAPLLFTFIFRRDSGKWGGPLETAIQDIVGSFAMVVMSYHLLRLFPSPEIQPDDVCGYDEM